MRRQLTQEKPIFRKLRKTLNGAHQVDILYAHQRVTISTDDTTNVRGVKFEPCCPSPELNPEQVCKKSSLDTGIQVSIEPQGQLVSDLWFNWPPTQQGCIKGEAKQFIYFTQNAGG